MTTDVNKLASKVMKTLVEKYEEGDPRARARVHRPFFAKIGVALALLFMLTTMLLIAYTTSDNDFKQTIFILAVYVSGMASPFLLLLLTYTFSLVMYRFTVIFLRAKDLICKMCNNKK